MTMVAAGPYLLPDPIRTGSNGVAFITTNGLIDAAAEKFAFIFDYPKDGTIDTIEFSLGAVTQAPGNGLKVSLQDVSASTGDPDGVVDQFRVVTAGLTPGAWVAPGLITSDGTDGGVKRTVTKGLQGAAVGEFASFSAGDSLSLSTINSSADSFHQRPYPDYFTAAWAKSSAAISSVALKYSDGSYAHIPGFVAYKAINTRTFGSGSSPNERALYFKSPVPLRVGGAWVRIAVTSAAADFTITLYDSDGVTPLATATVDASLLVTTVGRNGVFRFASDVTLAANTFYRLAIKPTTATTIAITDFDVNTAAIMDAHECGQSMYASSRTGAGAWTEVTTTRPHMGLLVTGNDDGATPAASVIATNLQLRLPDPITMVVRT